MRTDLVILSNENVTEFETQLTALFGVDAAELIMSRKEGDFSTVLEVKVETEQEMDWLGFLVQDIENL